MPIADYEPALYYFAVSISWRSALFDFEKKAGIQHVKAALEQWRKYLLGESSTAEPYSQYLLSIQSAKWEHWNRAVGGFAMPNMHLAFSASGRTLYLELQIRGNLRIYDMMILSPVHLDLAGGKIQFDDSMTDAAYGIHHVKVATDFWQKVAPTNLCNLQRSSAIAHPSARSTVTVLPSKLTTSSRRPRSASGFTGANSTRALESQNS